MQRPHSTQENACERDQLGHVLAGVESEIFVAGERRNIAEAFAAHENRRRAQDQMQVLGMRNQRQEKQQRQRVQPPD